MPTPRKQLISPEITTYYHCVSRCVRRAYLCGFDLITRKSYEHRRKWIEDRIHFLASIFAVDVCAYAVMSNHIHLVLHINTDNVGSWSDREICRRWHQVYKGTLLTQKYLRGEVLTQFEQREVEVKLALWRLRLGNISWFMRALNEPIARQANKEDECTGKFWESRFKSQALLDECALIACMAYVDLNPIRARISDTPEKSRYTSVRYRINSINSTSFAKRTIALMPFMGNHQKNTRQGLPFKLDDYLNLINSTSRIIRGDKGGCNSKPFSSILERLNIQTEKWLILSTKFESMFRGFIGVESALKKAVQKLGFKRTPNLSNCSILFS